MQECTCRPVSGWLIAGFMLFVLSFPASLHAQETESDTLDAEEQSAEEGAPLVYIDCGRCDYDHIRREISFVNYVRDQDHADIHVFITNTSLSGGGREYELSFIGRSDFAGLDYTFTHGIDRNATWDEERESLNQALEIGLMPYIMQTSLSSRFSIEYEAAGEGGQILDDDDNDPWDYWVFNIYAGSLEIGLESNQSNFDSRWGVSANRVTEAWKFHLRPYFNFEQDVIEREDEESVTSTRHRHGFNSHAVKSVSPHWSVGFFGTYLTRNDRNLRHDASMNPGVEYSFWPYDVATRRSLTVVYQVGYSMVEYYEPTIFDETAEGLFNHRLEASMRIQQPWGDIQTGLTGSHYLHNFAHRRAEFYGRISIQLTGGLSLDLRGDFEMIQDQLSLPKGDASLEEILLEQRELATDFSLSGSIALSYTFGSQDANIVNTRF